MTARTRWSCCERSQSTSACKILVRGLLIALLAVGLGSACSGTDPGTGTADAPPARRTATEAAAIDLLPESNQPRDGSPSSASAAAAGERGSPGDVSNEDPKEGFTPYEERVYPLGTFLNDLRSEVFGDQDFSDPMGSIEDLKHACMTEQGFRYGKIDWAAIDAEFEAATPSLAEEDYIPTRGYGFADSLDAPETTESSYVDPNEEIKDGLTAPELAAWEQQRRECARRAQDEVLGRAGVIRWALRDDLDALDERITADPRLAEAAREWSACMAGFGHHYADRAEIFDYSPGLPTLFRSVCVLLEATIASMRHFSPISML